MSYTAIRLALLTLLALTPTLPCRLKAQTIGSAPGAAEPQLGQPTGQRVGLLSRVKGEHEAPLRSAADSRRRAGATGLPLPARGSDEPLGEPGTGTLSWGRLGSALAAVAGLALIGLPLLRRLLPAAVHSQRAGPLELLDQLALTTHCSIYLLRCGPRLILVASSQSGVRQVGELRDPAEVESVLAELAGQRAGTSAGRAGPAGTAESSLKAEQQAERAAATGFLGLVQPGREPGQRATTSATSSVQHGEQRGGW